MRHSIDSIGQKVDSVGNIYAAELLDAAYFGIKPTVPRMVNGEIIRERRKEVAIPRPLDLDSIFAAPTPSSAKSYVTQALAQAKRRKQEYVYRGLALAEQAKLMRRHDIEMQKKFTLSIACIIFFFIGAPLGAIIKKGGIGTPLVLSVILFIVYFIFDNMGYKMARDGKLPVWEGIWLSTFVMAPLGIFFTYKAVGDSQLLNIDAYKNFFRRLTGKTAGRTLTLKEVRMTDVEPARATALLDSFAGLTDSTIEAIHHAPLWRRAWWRNSQGGADKLREPLGQLVDYLSNSPDIYVINLLNQYPFTPTARNIKNIADTTQALRKRFE